MGSRRGWFTLLLLLFTSSVAAAQPVRVEKVRLQQQGARARLVFELSGTVRHTLFTLGHPERIVLDLRGTRLARGALAGLDLGKSVIAGIRHAPRHGRNLRVVLDLRRRVRPRSLLQCPRRGRHCRLVVDLAAGPAGKPVRVLPHSARDVLVMVDPGHGGADPGATGPHHLHEKTVTLAIARRLKRLIDRVPGMRAELTRRGDYYVGLTRRVAKARKVKADMFVSIHADANRDRRAIGASVYTLSRRGATSAHARWLAKKENSADLVGGVSLGGKDNVLASVLLDLSQTATKRASADIAGRVLHNLDRIGPLHKRHVEKANFVVLRAPDIPSLLVETDFITNPHEERLLRRGAYQYKIARAILKGVEAHFRAHPPAGTLFAAREQRHVIARGETLSGIAHHYGLRVETLRRFNRLPSNRLQAGEVLLIPSNGDG